MKSSSTELQELGGELHIRMIGGDPTAFAELAESYMPWLLKKLNNEYPDLYDPDLINIAIVEALYKYQEKPQTYDPKKASLTTYLLMSARGDLRNLLSLGKNRVEIPLSEDVELDDDDTEYRVERALTSTDEDSVEEMVIARTTRVWSLIKEHLPDQRDQEICRLIIDNVRDTDEFSNVLDIQHLSIQEQRAIVKKHKDRIKKTLLRNVSAEELSGLYE